MSKLDALIARIKAEVVIRKRLDGTTSVEGPKQRAAKDRRARESDPALAALMAQANRDAKALTRPADPYKHFKPVGYAPLLQRQVCRCCGGEHVHVLAEMLHLQGRNGGNVPLADVWVRRSACDDLPTETPLWMPTQSIARCAGCLVSSESSPARSVEHSGQQPLFH